jgi:hypothetical protein
MLKLDLILKLFLYGRFSQPSIIISDIEVILKYGCRPPEKLNDSEP